MEVLGDTAKIAREKAGIFKPRVPAITSPQPEEAMAALGRARPKSRRALTIGRRSGRTGDAPPADGGGGGGGERKKTLENIRLGLAGAHQELNAALAVRLVRVGAPRALAAWARACEADLAAGRAPRRFAAASRRRSGGAAQVVPDPTEAPRTSWYLGGAHTEESMQRARSGSRRHRGRRRTVLRGW